MEARTETIWNGDKSQVDKIAGFAIVAHGLANWHASAGYSKA